MNNYKREFHNFDFDIPDIKGFIDASWHNDISPSFERKYSETEYVKFWIDYLDPDKRECGGKQFTVILKPFDDMSNDFIQIIETDSFDEALEKINQLFEGVTP
jgi:hypothetical protein